METHDDNIGIPILKYLLLKIRFSRFDCHRLPLIVFTHRFHCRIATSIDKNVIQLFFAVKPISEILSL
jgi:hypothetical protein